MSWNAASAPAVACDMTQDLDRFLSAQALVHDQAVAELRRGRKTSHWMWFIFPQIAGLGRSETARFYAISDAAEARAYLAHPLLGPRLIEATRTAYGIADTEVTLSRTGYTGDLGYEVTVPSDRAVDVLDAILHGLVEEELAVPDIVARGHDPATVARVERLLLASEYKRRQAPPGVKLGHRNFGRDRRYPITNAFRTS